MKKIALVIAAAAAIFVTTLPVSSPASAQTIVIGNGAQRDSGYRRDRGFRSRNEYRRSNYYGRRDYRRDRRGPAIIVRP